jgi:D-tagatose-1,6-bisphosphate aldolase subunit GatZ/KbaZ
MNLGAKGSAVHWLRDIADRNRRREAVGLFSVCSAHPQVLQAAMRQALASESMLCVESTSNQVNQFGGYTGLTPGQFTEYALHRTEGGLPERKGSRRSATRAGM